MKGFRKADLIRAGYNVCYVKLKNRKVLTAIRSKNILLRNYGEAVLEQKSTMWIPLPTGTKVKVRIDTIESIKT